MILVGDCRVRLAEIEPESVHMVWTSPPYYALRDYEIEPTIWGGDVGCRHQWGNEIPGDDKGGSGTPTDKNNRGEGYARGVARGALCECGAWRGQLGLEPTPEMFVQHLVEVCDQIWRVLRKDGSFWLNLGDSYVGGGNNRGNRSPLAAKQASNRGAVGQCSDHAKNIRQVEGLKRKDLIGVPWRTAFALQAAGWYLRSDIVLSKKNPMPESITDRPTRSHEYLFLFAKTEDYYYDRHAIAEKAVTQTRWPGVGPKHGGERDRDEVYEQMVAYDVRNKRDVWEITSQPYKGAHFATASPQMIEPCILAGTSEAGACSTCGKPWQRTMDYQKADMIRQRYRAAEAGAVGPHRGTVERPGGFVGAGGQTRGWNADCGCGSPAVPCVVLDPFSGAATTGLVAERLGRRYIGIEANPAYARMAEQRLFEDAPLFHDGALPDLLM